MSDFDDLVKRTEYNIAESKDLTARARDVIASAESQIPILSSLAQRYAPIRAAVYLLLITPPFRHWTVMALHGALSVPRPHPNSVRDVVYVLVACGVVVAIKGQRALTVVMTAAGAVALRRVLDGWERNPRTDR